MFRGEVIVFIYCRSLFIFFFGYCFRCFGWFLFSVVLCLLDVVLWGSKVVIGGVVRIRSF